MSEGLMAMTDKRCFAWSRGPRKKRDFSRFLSKTGAPRFHQGRDGRKIGSKYLDVTPPPMCKDTDQIVAIESAESVGLIGTPLEKEACPFYIRTQIKGEGCMRL
jgi:hypothetical protein